MALEHFGRGRRQRDALAGQQVTQPAGDRGDGPDGQVADRSAEMQQQVLAVSQGIEDVKMRKLRSVRLPGSGGRRARYYSPGLLSRGRLILM